MKPRHLLSFAALALVLVVAVVGCSIFSVSLTDRVSTFQGDLNSSSRSSIYMNFDSVNTNDYNSLKSSTVTIDNLFPVPGTYDTPYALTITDDTSPSTGVLVTVTGGPASYGGTHHLILVMDTAANGDYQIVSLSMDNGSGTYPGTPQIQ